MAILGTILLTICFSALVLLEAMKPLSLGLPLSVLKQRQRQGIVSKFAVEQEEYLPQLLTLFKLKQLMLTAAAALIAVGFFGYLLGILLVIFIVITFGSVSRFKAMTTLAARLMRTLAPKFLRLSHILKGFLRIVATKDVSATPHKYVVESIDELTAIIHASSRAIPLRDREAIQQALVFPMMKVAEVMTPRRDIKSVDMKEFLGPLVLSELHEFGHRQLPVIDKSLDTIVGTLVLDELLSLDIKRSVTAGKAMDSRVVQVSASQPLSEALETLLAEHRYLAIVVDETGQTLGLVTLSDIMKHIPGLHLASKG